MNEIETEHVLFPLPNDEERMNGWSFSVQHMKKVQAMTVDDNPVSLEDVDVVLRSLLTIYRVHCFCEGGDDGE